MPPWIRDWTESALFWPALGTAACLLFAVWALHRHHTVGRGGAYRRINWMVPALLAVSFAFVGLVHVVNLAGFETGGR